MQSSQVTRSEATHHADTNWETIGAWWRAWWQSRRATLAPGTVNFTILETIPSPMIVFDESGMVQRFNRAAERLFGHAAGDVIGKNAGFLIEGGLPAECIGESGIPPGEGIRCEVSGRRRSGAAFPMELMLGELRSGNRRYFAGLIVDLSEYRHALLRFKALQGDMIHASRLRLMGTMASSMAHELNQPLSAIANYLGGLKHAVNREEQERMPAFAPILDKTAEQAIRAGRIISRLRDFIARGETERRPESIGKLIDEAATLAFMGSGDRGVRLSLSFDPACDLVLVDRVQIQQVLLNLMRNALEAMAGVGHLAISTLARAEDMLTVRIEDTGSGMTKGVMDRLFEPFATTKSDGMGLGLSISRTIIEAHGGLIWHEPASQDGAVFCFTIPRVTQDEVAYVE